MRRHPSFLIGWLLAATVLLSLAGLTAEPSPAAAIGADQIMEADPNETKQVVELPRLS